MVASQTIEPIKLIDANLNQDCTQKVSNSNSNEFENVFESVSKNYSDENSSSENVTSENVTNENATSEKKSADNKTEQDCKNKDNIEQNKNNSDNKASDNKAEPSNDISVDSSENTDKDIKIVENKNIINIQEIEKKSDLQQNDFTNKVDSENNKISIPVENVEVKNIEKNDTLSDALKQLNDSQSLELNAEKIAATELSDLKIYGKIQKENANEIINNTAKTNTLETKTSENIIAEKVLQDSVLSTSLTEKLTANIEIDANVELIARQNLQKLSSEVTSDAIQKNPEIINSTDVQKVISDNTKSDVINVLPAQKEQATPLVKLTDDTVLQNIKLSSADMKQDVKNILDKTDLNQQKIDDLNVEIKSVKTTFDNQNLSNNSGNNNPNNFLAQQNLVDQAVKLELQSSSNLKLPEINVQAENTISAAESVDNILNLQATKINTNISQTQETFSTQAPRTLNQSDIFSQINKQLDAQMLQDNGTTKVNIVLRPENLGKLELELVNSKNGLEAKIVASSPQIKEMLDKNIDTLRETLANQGVNVNNVNVKISESQKSDTMFSFDQQSKEGNQQEQNSSNKTKGNKFSDIENNIEEDLTDNTEEKVLSEKTATIAGLNGKVSYKL